MTFPRFFRTRLLNRSAVWWFRCSFLTWILPSGAQESQNFPLNEQDGSFAEITHIFSAVPPGGYTTVRVTLTNKGKEELSLKVDTQSTTPAARNEHLLSSPGTAVACKPESTTVREILVPLMTDFSSSRGYRNNDLDVAINVGGRSYHGSFRSGKDDSLPFWAVSQSLGGSGAMPLNEAARVKAGGSSGYNSEKFAASFLPAHLPSDWRAYTGLDGLALTVEEWNTLLPGVRTAIRQWLLLGGVLDLYHNGPEPAAILQELKVEPAGTQGASGENNAGAGKVRIFAWDGTVLGDPVLKRFEAAAGVPVRHVAAREAMIVGTSKTPGSALQKAMGVRSFAAWQVGVILLLFGILVGPVNLFYFAGPGRRHRLFVTTPVIALAASAVLVAVIFLQDGAGGSGRRAVLLELFPEDNLSAVRQYQISRTGVLFGGGFTLGEPAVVTPLLLENTRWTRLKPSDHHESEGQRYTVTDGLAYAGDWFQSRSEQAQLVETLRPGRGRVELKSGTGDPILTSSLGGSLSAVFYQDAAGQWWTTGAPLTTGGSAALQKSDDAAFDKWFTEQTASFPVTTVQNLESRTHRGRFYAVSRDAGMGVADTLKSIEWQDDLAFLHGRLVPAP